MPPPHLGKTKTPQTATLRVAILSDVSARRLSQNFGAKLKQKSAQVRAAFSWKFAGTEYSHLQCYRLRCFSFAQHMADPHGDLQTSPQHANPHGLLAWFSFRRHQVHVDRRVEGSSRGRDVGHLRKDPAFQGSAG